MKPRVVDRAAAAPTGRTLAQLLDAPLAGAQLGDLATGAGVDLLLEESHGQLVLARHSEGLFNRCRVVDFLNHFLTLERSCLAGFEAELATL